MPLPSADLSALLEKVKGLEGPDRELDALIFCATAPTDEVWEECGPPGCVTQRAPLIMRGWKEAPPLTAFTDLVVSRLDARLPRWGFRFSREPDSKLHVATLLQPPECPDAAIDDSRSWSRHCEGGGPTLALAALAALLAALIQRGSDADAQ